MIKFWAAHKINEDGSRSNEYDDNFYLSNFYKAPLKDTVYGEQITFRTSENYFQAMKFLHDKGKFMQIALAKTPMEAAKLGRSFSNMDPNWDEKRNSIMYTVLMLKFQYNPILMEKLLATGEEELVEDSPKDWYWGWGADHTGENMLGKILMEVRDQLRMSNGGKLEF
jgi:ribA/ribD-fused uncharacterized protein